MKLIMLLLALGSFSAFAAKCDELGQKALVDQCQFDQIDARLITTYQNVLTLVDRRAEVLLRTSQRGWVQMRDTQCAAEDYLFSPTLETVNTCKIRMTRARISELNLILRRMNH